MNGQRERRIEVQRTKKKHKDLEKVELNAPSES